MDVGKKIQEVSINGIIRGMDFVHIIIMSLFRSAVRYFSEKICRNKGMYKLKYMESYKCFYQAIKL